MFVIRGRKSWGAMPARSATLQPSSSIKTLVVHHTAGRAAYSTRGAKAELRAIQRLHMNTNGWSDIGYNFIIDRAGRVWEGRGYNRIGAHTKVHNTGTIGVAFMGNYEHLTPTLRQRIAFRALKRRLRSKNIRPREVKGHNQMPDQATACPGKHLSAALKL